MPRCPRASRQCGGAPLRAFCGTQPPLPRAHPSQVRAPLPAAKTGGFRNSQAPPTATVWICWIGERVLCHRVHRTLRVRRCWSPARSPLFLSPHCRLFRRWPNARSGPPRGLSAYLQRVVDWWARVQGGSGLQPANPGVLAKPLLWRAEALSWGGKGGGCRQPLTATDGKAARGSGSVAAGFCC
jgi:hypothetical protein